MHVIWQNIYGRACSDSGVYLTRNETKLLRALKIDMNLDGTLDLVVELTRMKYILHAD